MASAQLSSAVVIEETPSRRNSEVTKYVKQYAGQSPQLLDRAEHAVHVTEGDTDQPRKHGPPA